MHRLVPFKLKKKQHDSNRSAAKKSSADQFGNGLPFLELSLPDSKSFRASVILPDLSRRFTLLKKNGELLPVNNFCEHVRHELETGHITQEDENILIRQYRQQYISETSSLYYPTSTSGVDTALESLPPSKLSPRSPNLLFSGASSARDAAYIRKAKMANDQKPPSAPQKKCQVGDNALTEQIDSASTSDLTSENLTLPTHVDDQSTAQTTEVIRTTGIESAIEDSDDETSLELTQNQMQRLSLAVDRILGSHLAIHSSDSNSDSTSQQDHAEKMSSPSGFVSNPLNAESRVHDELLRALSNESPARFPSPQPLLQDNSASLMYDIDSSIGHLDDDGLELLSESSFEDGSSIFQLGQSDFDDIPLPAPTFDHSQPLPFGDLTYDDALFIQCTLCSSQDFSIQHTNPLAIYSSSIHDDTLMSTSDRPVLGHLVSTSPTGVLASPNTAPAPLLLGPRSSSLHHRLNLSKNMATASGRKASVLYQLHSNLHSPTESCFSPTLLPQVLSPSSADSQFASSFPVTPPTVTQPSEVGNDCAPSSPIDSNPPTGEILEARPRRFKSRAGRPIPTTILFRDVEAQAVAANAALNKSATSQLDGSASCKKLHSRKKSVSTAQIGAPTLLSASTKLNELELEKTGAEISASCTEKSKGIAKKSTFKLRLKKKRPSGSRFSHDDGDTTHSCMSKRQDSTHFQDNEDIPYTIPSATFLEGRDSFNASPVQINNPLSSDPPGSYISWKSPQALTNRVRKLMGRQRKMTTNTASFSKLDLEPASPLDSISTSSEVALVPQLPTSHTFQELGLESDVPSVWPSSASKSSARRSMSQSFNDVGMSSPDTPCDSDIDNHHTPNPLVVSFNSPDSTCPINSVNSKSQEEMPPFPIPKSNITQDHLESRDSMNPEAESKRESYSNDEPVATGDDGSRHQECGPGNTQATSPQWLDQGSERHFSHSDYASSILDLYSEAQSIPAVSPKRFSSSSSCYSNPADPTRPSSGVLPANGIQSPHRRSNGLQIGQQSGTMVPPESHLRPNNIAPRERNSTQNELMVMVQQLQSSTRYSEFEPAVYSLNRTDENSAASFIQQIVKQNPAGNSFKMMDQIPRDKYADDVDEEAAVWKNILKE